MVFTSQPAIGEIYRYILAFLLPYILRGVSSIGIALGLRPPETLRQTDHMEYERYVSFICMVSYFYDTYIKIHPIPSCILAF